MAKNKDKILPSVISFEKAVVTTDAEMENVELFLRGMRTLQDINSGNKGNVVNLQKSEYAIATKDTVTVKFKFKPLTVKNKLTQINDVEIYNKLQELYKKEEFDKSLKLNSEYIAYNICNGRWLWRNKGLSNSVNIIIDIIKEEETKEIKKTFKLNEIDIPDNINIKKDTENILGNEIDYIGINEEHGGIIKELAEWIYKGFNEENNEYAEIKAELDVFEGMQVYPSELFLNQDEFLKILKERYDISAGKNEKIRLFYKTANNNKPALTDVKIWNALRTYDVWYDKYDVVGAPISIEITGGNLKFQEQLRNNNKIFKRLLEKYLKDKEFTADEWLYFTGCLIRGGVPV